MTSSVRNAIDDSSMTHRSLIDYHTGHERHFSCFLVPFFFVCHSFICIKQEKGNELLHQPQIGGRNFRKFSHLQKMALETLYKDIKFPSHEVIEEFCKTEQPRRGNCHWYGSTTNGCLHLSCFNFVFSFSPNTFAVMR